MLRKQHELEMQTIRTWSQEQVTQLLEVLQLLEVPTLLLYFLIPKEHTDLQQAATEKHR